TKTMSSSRSRLAAMMAGAIALSLTLGAPADARRGGSFGSRGARTYSAPRPTTSTPGYVAPVQRSMTAPATGVQPGAPGYAPAYGYGAAPGFGQSRFRPGFGGGLLTGLVTGGLIGGLMGHGWGGGVGGGWGGGGGGALFAGLFQIALLLLLGWFVVRLFRRRSQAAAAPMGFASPFEAAPTFDDRAAPPGAPWGATPAYAQSAVPAEIPVSPVDRQAFERLLLEVQDAFGREDYGALRERTTPEVMSYLAEELSQNATQGRRNEVSRVRLLGSDVSEAWREGDADYATVALNYESVDLMRDRTTGAVLQGDPDRPTPTTELWTFVRHNGGPWKVSAIQET
ncbi:MAG: preprotein translocase subunit Tim44, partial [Phenylobacterium sp.]|nr:preprotein translocase subunit Tim44 [Phenylobacterium sp.]